MFDPFVNERVDHPLIVRLPFFLFVGCSNDLGLINQEDANEIRKGVDLNDKAMKVALSLVNLCGNMKDARYEPTMAAMSFIHSITNDEYNINNILRKKSKCTTSTESSSGDDKEEGEVIEPERKKLESTILNKKTSIMKHQLTSTVNVPKKFNLDDFISTLIDDDDDFFFPEFKIREDIERTNNDTILLLEDK